MEVGFRDSISVVILCLNAPLFVPCNVSQQQVGKGIAGRDRRGCIERQNPLNVRRVLLVFLGKRGIKAKLECVRSPNLRHVIAVRIHRVGVVPREVAGILGEARIAAPAVCGVALELYRREFSSERRALVGEQSAHREGRGKCRIIKRSKENMVGGIAGDEFIEKGGGDVSVEAGHEARPRPDEIRLYALKLRRAVSPQGIRHNGAPGIVNVAEGQTVIVRKVVVDADQLFTPGGRC